MTRKFSAAGGPAVLLALLVLSLAPARAADAVSANDMARYLGGLAPSAGSPLAALTAEPAWKHHARALDQAWNRISKSQLSKIRAWSDKTIQGQRKLMLYMFSGPDFLYADAFFPHAETYVLSALEPVGPIPDVTRLSRGSRSRALQNVRASLQSVLSYSFFLTKEMKVDLRSGNLTGTLPLLYAFLARAGNTLSDVEHVSLNPDGTVSPRDGRAPKGSSEGVKIVFTGEQGKTRTLYYFATDLSNGGLKKSGFMTFVSGYGPADSLVKSASYLLHSGSFKTARDFLMEKSAVIIQDPSGIPVKYFAAKSWDLHPFGTYRGPIPLFSNYYQSGLKSLFARGRSKPIDWGIGYRWRKHETSVLLAVKKEEQALKDEDLPVKKEKQEAKTEDPPAQKEEEQAAKTEDPPAQKAKPRVKKKEQAKKVEPSVTEEERTGQ